MPAGGTTSICIRPAGPLRQPQCDPHRKSCGLQRCNTSQQSHGREIRGEAEGDGKTRRAKDGVAGVVPAFYPLESLLSPCPRLENQAHRSVKLLTLKRFYFPLTFSCFLSLHPLTILPITQPKFVIFQGLKSCICCIVFIHTHT